MRRSTGLAGAQINRFILPTLSHGRYVQPCTVVPAPNMAWDGAYTRPLASVRGQTFSSWHESSCGIPKGGLLVLLVCRALGLDSAHDLLRCCVTRGDMSIVWSGVSNRGHKHRGTVPILGLWPAFEAKRFPHGTRAVAEFQREGFSSCSCAEPWD